MPSIPARMLLQTCIALALAISPGHVPAAAVHAPGAPLPEEPALAESGAGLWLDQPSVIQSPQAPNVDQLNIACTEAAFDSALAVVQGSGSGRITFAGGFAGCTIPITTTKVITANVTIAGVQLDGQLQRRIFEVQNGGRLKLDTMRLANGRNVGGGGGMAVLMRRTSTLEMQDVILENHVSGTGGAINAEQFPAGAPHTIIMTGTRFVSNRAIFGGALFAHNAVVRITDSEFTGNRADIRGGAIQLTDASVTISNTRIYSNTSLYWGGGIYGVSNTLDIRNSQVYSNHADGYGGGILVAGVSTTTIQDSAFTGNRSLVHGAGILYYGGQFALTRTLVSGNRAGNPAFPSSAARGGGLSSFIDSFPGQPPPPAPVSPLVIRAHGITVTENSTAGNFSADSAGGFFLFQTALHLSSSSFFSNTGRALQAQAGSAYITDTQFVRGHGIDYSIGTLHITGSRVLSMSRSSSVFAAEMHMVGSEYRGNVGEDTAGLSIGRSTAMITDSLFAENRMTGTNPLASPLASGLHLFDSSATLFNTAMVSNTTSRSGGGVLVQRGTLDITGGQMYSNTAAGSGGGMYADRSTVNLTGTQIYSNAARNLGGGIASQTSTLSILNASVTTNTAPVGGGLSLRYTGTTSISGTLLAGNRAITAGGAIELDNRVGQVKALDVRGSRFVRNTSGEQGGAMIYCCTVFARVQITDSEFTSNSATFDGGAIYSDGMLNVSGSRFSSNSASGGGALQLWRPPGTSAPAEISATAFLSNSATGSFGTGGAIYNVAPLTVTRALFQGNQAGRLGGALYSTGSDVLLRESTLWNNTAVLLGGAVGNDSARFDIVNSTIASNTASSGGAILNDFAGDMRLTHVTLAGNSASSGGLRVVDGTITLRNTALQRGATGANCVAVAPGSFVSLGNNLFDDASCSSFAIAGDLPNTAAGLGALADNGGGTILPGVPMLTMAPLPGSALLEKGACLPEAPADQRGVLRPQDGDNNGSALCDIGAVELSLATPTPTPTNTPTNTPTSTPTSTNTPTPTATSTVPPGSTATHTSTPTSTATAGTATPTPTATGTSVPKTFVYLPVALR